MSGYNRIIVLPMVVAPLVCPPGVFPAQAIERNEAWWVSSMRIDEARAVTRAEGVKLCLVDSGVDAKHPDLEGVHLEGGVDLDGGPGEGLTPHTPHGTAMAIYAAGNGSGPDRHQGIVGAASGATIVSAGATSGGMGLYPDQFWQGIEYCIASGARVINLSLKPSGGFDAALIALAQQRDIVVVAGAGNDSDHQYVGGAWGNYFGVLQVAGVDRDLSLDPQSNSGAGSKGPGGGVVTQGIGLCGPFGDKPNQPLIGGVPGGGYAYIGGTSAATAVVSGVVAAVRAKFPELKAGDVINRVLKTAKKVGTGEVPTPECGWGIVDAAAALTADVPSVDGVNPLGRLEMGKAMPGRGAVDVGSMGVWDPTYKAENDVSYTPKPLPSLKFQPPGATPSDSSSSSSAASTVVAGPASSPSGGGSVPWAWVAGLGVAALAVVGGGVAWMMRRGQRS